MKYKVGDRVMVNMPVSELWVEFYGTISQPARIVGVSTNAYTVEVENHTAEDDGKWIAEESELSLLAPAIPAGWTPASEPPDSDRNVRVMLNDGREWYGWHWFDAPFDVPEWFLFKQDVNDLELKNLKEDLDYSPGSESAAPGEVIGWREIEQRKARYVVTRLDGQVFDTIEDAESIVKKHISESGAVCICRIVEEVKPGEPVITKFEE